MTRHLILRLEAPLMSFGAEAVDAYGVVRDFPARSAVTGLIGNALGWDRTETEALDALQWRLVMGAVRLREGRRLREFQTAHLSAADRGWTTRGRPEGRAGGAGTYESPHIRYRDADADALVLVVLRLEPADDAPDLAAVASALDRPERPLFVGRKPFLPSCRIQAGFVDAPNVKSALLLAAIHAAPADGGRRAQWPLGEGDASAASTTDITDDRQWRVDVHAGLRPVIEGGLDGVWP